MGLDRLLTRPQLCHNQVQVHLPTDTQDKQEQRDFINKSLQVESRVKLKHENYNSVHQSTKYKYSSAERMVQTIWEQIKFG